MNMFFSDLNVWFIPESTDPIASLKKAMQKDGYWDDCEIEDEHIAKTEYVTVTDDIAKKLKKGYKSINYLQSEGEVEACFETIKAIAKQFKV